MRGVTVHNTRAPTAPSSSVEIGGNDMISWLTLEIRSTIQGRKMKTPLFLLCMVVFVVLVACAAPTPTATPVPPTATAIPPTLTPVPPTQLPASTSISVPPIAPMPTATVIPPTPTAIPPTSTPTLVPPIPTAIPPTSASTLPTPTPRAVSQATIRVSDLDRTYLYYAPTNLPRNAPLLFAFHGASMNAERMRAATVYEFESLADQYGFVVVYPQGYQNSWNVCTKFRSVPAQTQNIDDVGFIRALITKFHADYGINTSQVFAMGYSDGGSLAYRLAFELPDEITAVAAIGANLPTDDNFDCRISEKPIPALIMNGTSDPFCPYNGGLDTIGKVRSAQASAEYFAKLNGQTSSPKTTRLPHEDISDPTSVDRTVWNDAGKPEVVLVTINGGGHTIPQPKVAFPAAAGRTNKDLNGLVEIWDFFARQKPLK
jgi:polyhydroxybutyrate depolymerase